MEAFKNKYFTESTISPKNIYKEHNCGFGFYIVQKKKRKSYEAEARKQSKCCSIPVEK